MSATSFSWLRDFVEPAHPAVIKFQDDLVAIYSAIRERYQSQIDDAFSEVARRTGFVVTTTLPVVLKVAEGRTRVEMGGENLRGTLFEEAMLKLLEPLTKEPTAKLAAGDYPFYLIWLDALKLKLRTDWIEPAHRLPLDRSLVARQKFGWGVYEPAHWFDPRLEIDVRDALIINAIDQVYPELRLMDRVEAARGAVIGAGIRPIGPGIREPAHLFGPGVREPAHFRRFLQELDPRTLDRLIEVMQEFRRGG